MSLAARLAALGSLALAACIDHGWCEPPTVSFSGTEPCPPLVVAPSWTPPAPGDFLTIDDVYGLAAERVPGFGGVYPTAAGWYAYLLDPTPEAVEELKRALAELTGEPGWRAAAVAGVRGQYDYRELLEARRQLEWNLGGLGWSFTDIDEARNRVLVGWYDPMVPRCMLEALRGLGLDERIVITPYEAPSCAARTRPRSWAAGGPAVSASSGR